MNKIEGDRVQVRLQAEIVAEAAAANDGELPGILARVIEPGRTEPIEGFPDGVLIPADVLMAAVPLFDGAPVFVNHDYDHPGRPRDMRDFAGTVVKASYDGGVLAQLYPAAGVAGEVLAGLARSLRSLRQAGLPLPDVGLSIDGWWHVRDGVAQAISKIRSVDIVHGPAAGGRLLASTMQGDRSMSEETTVAAAGVTSQAAVQPGAMGGADGNDWLKLLSATAISGAIRNSGLPQPTQARLLSGTYRTADEVTAAIDAARTELAALQENQVIQMGGVAPRQQVVMGLNGYEELKAAAEALILGQRPGKGVRPLSGVRELYLLLSGDYEMHGVFHGDRIQFASVNSSTMAEITANVLNKAVINSFGAFERWWDGALTEMDFATLQDVEWISLGGIGELPTVAEGAAYPELGWDDQGETSAFVKKGGYVGISLEAMDKDQTSRLQAAPQALARAAWMTLGKAIAAIFTSNSNVGPTMGDSVALFGSHSSGTNLGSTALSWTSWDATRTAMEKFTEINSAERLGGLTSPKLLWVPTDLETTALQILGSLGVPGGANNDVNVFANENERAAALQMARRRVIKVPFWTDTNNWAAQADPALYPSIGLGYRFGRTPEVFSVASPTAGLMFTNDTMPVKVRFFFACGPTDWRGLYKHNVA